MNTRKAHLRKPDLVVLVLCVALLITCFAAVGETGRKRAKEIVCLAHLHQWGSFFDSYVEDHDGNFNPGWDVGETTLWMNALRPYYQDQWPLLLCPAATMPNESAGNPSAFATWCRTVQTPNGSVQRFVSSYGINSWTNNMTHSRGFRQKSGSGSLRKMLRMPIVCPSLLIQSGTMPGPNRRTCLPRSHSARNGMR